MVAERFAPDSKRRIEKPDMMQSFIKHGLTQEEAVAESLIQILGGSDTSATVIRVIMLYIMTNHRVYAKLQAEIDEGTKNNRISSPVIKDSEARKLPYLQAVIREGLRIWPAATGLMSKVTPPEGDTINGLFVPGGVNIGSNLWSILRSTETFGQDSDCFRPERWLEASPEIYTHMERVGELIWGYGKYKCLGRNVALMELNKIFVELLRNFDWTLINPTKAWNSECVGLWIQSDLFVRVTERGAKD